MSTKISWICFGLTGSLSDTYVHFFPGGGKGKADSEVNLELSIFADRIEKRSIRVEGGSTNSPDGIRVADAFPHLREGQMGGLFGIKVSLITKHRFVDLKDSEVVVELHSSKGIVRYRPSRLVDGSEIQQEPAASVKKPGLLISDSLTSTSLVMLNDSDQASTIELELDVGIDSSQTSSSLRPEYQIGPNTVKEVFLTEMEAFSKASKIVGSWGETIMMPLKAKCQRPNSYAYLMYRDRDSNQPAGIEVLT